MFTSAARADNPELVAARARRIPVIPRAELLGELMRLRFGIAVAGAHGKTTTTSMIALVLERAGLDPTAVIGGRLSAFGSNSRLGRGDYMVAEADESDRSFLKLWPSIAVITNIDREHMEAYGSFADLQQAFVEFANKVPFYGAVVACADDPELDGAASALHATGDHLWADARRRGHRRAGRRARRVRQRQRPWCAAARCRRRPRDARRRCDCGARASLGSERAGRGRRWPRARRAVRLDCVGARGVSRARSGASNTAARSTASRVIDDYGHHPTEIAAVLAAARAAHPTRVIVAFQPHRYTRTRDLMREFGMALAAADEVVLTDIYAASEEPIPGGHGRSARRGDEHRRATPVRVVRRSSTSLRRWRRWRCRRSRDHDGRGIDRQRAAQVVERAERRGTAESAERLTMPAVAAPADKRFRRAHVKPARRRGAALRQAGRPLASWSCLRP